ncbi:unnamed protein product, partial [Strongylus vulgaris]
VTGAFALPRCVYSIADDGLIFSFFATVNKFTKVPLNAIVVFTLLNATLAMVFDLEALVEFLSIGTLLAYSVVSACVLILRYQPAPINGDPENLDTGNFHSNRKIVNTIMPSSFFHNLLLNSLPLPPSLSPALTLIIIFVFSSLFTLRGAIKPWVPFRDYWESLPAGRTISIAVCTLVFGFFWLAFTIRLRLHLTIPGYISIAFSVILIIVAFTFICGHKQNALDLSFKVPLVPLIPSLGLLINCFMMAYLAYLTWIRFFIWMFIGK